MQSYPYECHSQSRAHHLHQNQKCRQKIQTSSVECTAQRSCSYVRNKGWYTHKVHAHYLTAQTKAKSQILAAKTDWDDDQLDSWTHKQPKANCRLAIEAPQQLLPVSKLIHVGLANALSTSIHKNFDCWCCTKCRFVSICPVWISKACNISFHIESAKQDRKLSVHQVTRKKLLQLLPP